MTSTNELKNISDDALLRRVSDLLKPHLTDSNCDEVLARATHKTKREIEELVAELAPKPDVPASLRKLPAWAESTPAVQLVPERVTVLPTRTTAHPASPVPTQLAPPPPASPARPSPPAAPVPSVRPLSPARCKVQFTASAELEYGKERMEQFRGGGDRVSEPTSGYFLGYSVTTMAAYEAARSRDA